MYADLSNIAPEHYTKHITSRLTDIKAVESPDDRGIFIQILESTYRFSLGAFAGGKFVTFYLFLLLQYLFMTFSVQLLVPRPFIRSIWLRRACRTNERVHLLAKLRTGTRWIVSKRYNGSASLIYIILFINFGFYILMYQKYFFNIRKCILNLIFNFNEHRYNISPKQFEI